MIYSDHLAYVEQLRSYHAQFPKEQLLVLIYEDFRRENEATVRRVLRFLEVDDTVAIPQSGGKTAVSVRSPRLERAVARAQAGRGPISGPARRMITTLTPQELRRKLFYPLRQRVVYRRPEPVDQALVNELRHRFKPEVEALSEYLGRDLVALWGYDSIQ